MRYIDKTPPAPTGDPKRDVELLTDYVAQLQEQINFILSTIYKRFEGG